MSPTKTEEGYLQYEERTKHKLIERESIEGIKKFWEGTNFNMGISMLERLPVETQ